MAANRETSFIESRAARFVALAIFALCAGLLVYIQRDDLFPQASKDDVAQTNPEYLKCRDERITQAKKLPAEGVIDQAKHDLFLEKGIAYCQGRFPPGAPAR